MNGVVREYWTRMYIGFRRIWVYSWGEFLLLEEKGKEGVLVLPGPNLWSLIVIFSMHPKL